MLKLWEDFACWDFVDTFETDRRWLGVMVGASRGTFGRFFPANERTPYLLLFLSVTCELLADKLLFLPELAALTLPGRDELPLIFSSAISLNSSHV